jgi:hypothetical protein
MKCTKSLPKKCHPQHHRPDFRLNLHHVMAAAAWAKQICLTELLIVLSTTAVVNNQWQLDSCSLLPTRRGTSMTLIRVSDPCVAQTDRVQSSKLPAQLQIQLRPSSRRCIRQSSRGRHRAARTVPRPGMPDWQAAPCCIRPQISWSPPHTADRHNTLQAPS